MAQIRAGLDHRVLAQLMLEDCSAALEENSLEACAWLPTQDRPAGMGPCPEDLSFPDGSPRGACLRIPALQPCSPAAAGACAAPSPLEPGLQPHCFSEVLQTFQQRPIRPDVSPPRIVSRRNDQRDEGIGHRRSNCFDMQYTEPQARGAIQLSSFESPALENPCGFASQSQSSHEAKPPQLTPSMKQKLVIALLTLLVEDAGDESPAYPAQQHNYHAMCPDAAPVPPPATQTEVLFEQDQLHALSILREFGTLEESVLAPAELRAQGWGSPSAAHDRLPTPSLHPSLDTHHGRKRIGGGNGLRCNRRSGFRGVRLRKWGTWAAEIREPKSPKRIWLGTFGSPKTAAQAFDIAARMLHGPTAYLNFPDEMELVPFPSIAAKELLRASRKTPTPCVESHATMVLKDHLLRQVKSADCSQTAATSSFEDHQHQNCDSVQVTLLPSQAIYGIGDQPMAPTQDDLHMMALRALSF